MRERYAPIFERCEPYLVLSARYRDRICDRPLGVALPPQSFFDPLDPRSAAFLGLVQRLDDLTYGPRGLTMPRWVLYDCAEMPGGIFGFGRRAADLADWVRAALGVEEGYEGIVPLSSLVVVPMLPPGAFLNYTLCSLNQVSPGAAPTGLRLLTKVLGLKVFPVGTLYGTTQWRSPGLAIHTRFGPLELVTAYTPAHTLPNTLTFRFPLSEERLAGALLDPEPGQPPRGAVLLDVDDDDALRRLQVEIEAGARYEIVGAPTQRGAVTRVPLRRG